jgi:hypothetical protein
VRGKSPSRERSVPISGPACVWPYMPCSIGEDQRELISNTYHCLFTLLRPRAPDAAPSTSDSLLPVHHFVEAIHADALTIELPAVLEVQGVAYQLAQVGVVGGGGEVCVKHNAGDERSFSSS